MKKMRLLVGLTVAAMLVTGCGSGSAKRAMKSAEAASYDYAGDYGNAMAEEAPMYDDYEMAEEAAEVNTTSGEGAQADQVEESAATASDRKLIRTVNLSVETTDYDGIVKNIKAKVNQLGGYFESMNEYRNSYGSTDRKSASMTIRVPKKNADALLSSLEEQTNVTSYGEDMEDVTLAYVDMESHKKALQSEEERLLELMDKAETIEDLIVIEQRLSNVRYQIESMESQLRTYDNKVDYTTVYLNIQEVVHITPAAEPGFFARIGNGFSENLYDVVEGILDFIIGVITAIPYLIVWGIILAVLFFVGRILFRKIRKAADAHEEKAFEKRAQRTAKLNAIRENAAKMIEKAPGKAPEDAKTEVSETETNEGADENKSGE